MRWCWNILHKHPGGRWTRYTLRTASNQWSIYASCTKTNMLSIFHASAVLSNNSLDNQKQITHRMAAVLQVNVWGAFMAHMFEVCWETRSSNYISVWVHCLVGTVKAKQKKKKKNTMDQKLFLHENDQQSSRFFFSRILLFLQLYDIVSLLCWIDGLIWNKIKFFLLNIT